jgi:hypothetical protein
MHSIGQNLVENREHPSGQLADLRLGRARVESAAAYRIGLPPDLGNELVDQLVDAFDLVLASACLREWRITARALSDPLAREILTGPGDDDYGEVTRPEG